MKYHRIIVPRSIDTTGESGLKPYRRLASIWKRVYSRPALKTTASSSDACCPNLLRNKCQQITHGNTEYKRVYKAVPFLTCRRISVTSSANALDTAPPSFPALPTHTFYESECYLPRYNLNGSTLTAERVTPPIHTESKATSSSSIHTSSAIRLVELTWPT